MVQERKQPLEFTRFWLKLNDNRQLKAAKGKEKLTIVKKLLSTCGIRQKVAMFSLIGAAYVEIYCAVDQENAIIEKLQVKNITTISELNIEECPDYTQDVNKAKNYMVLRLARCYNYASTQRMKQAVLKNLTDGTKQAIVNKANEIKNGPAALVGTQMDNEAQSDTDNVDMEIELDDPQIHSTSQTQPLVSLGNSQQSSAQSSIPSGSNDL